jgi:hypothetical protein
VSVGSSQVLEVVLEIGTYVIVLFSSAYGTRSAAQRVGQMHGLLKSGALRPAARLPLQVDAGSGTLHIGRRWPAGCGVPAVHQQVYPDREDHER